MTRINLLPWREARRKQQQLNFILMLAAAAVFAGLVVAAAYFQMEQLIDNQQARNDYLKGEIARLKKAEEEIKELEKVKARLIRRLTVIQNLQARRPGMVRAFDTLARLLPETIYLTTLGISGDQLTLKGNANSNNIVSDFLRNLDESPWFGEPSLKVINNQMIGEVRASVFELSVNQTQGGGQAPAAAGAPAGSGTP